MVGNSQKLTNTASHHNLITDGTPSAENDKTTNNQGQSALNKSSAPTHVSDAKKKRAKKPSLSHALTPPSVIEVPLNVTQDAVFKKIDEVKALHVELLRYNGTLDDAVEVASKIASLHEKPKHADEVCKMADNLIGDLERDIALLQQVKLAARLVALGEWKIPVVDMLGDRMSDEERHTHISQTNRCAAAVLRDIEGGEILAQAIEGNSLSDVSPWLHVCLDISAMATRRKLRQSETHPSGQLSLAEIRAALQKNDLLPGRDPTITAKFLAHYESLEKS